MWHKARHYPLQIHQFIHSFIHQFIRLSIHPFIHQFIDSSIKFIHPCIDSFIHSSIHTSIYSSIHPSIHSFIHFLISQPIECFRYILLPGVGLVWPFLHESQNPHHLWGTGASMERCKYLTECLCTFYISPTTVVSIVFVAVFVSR